MATQDEVITMGLKKALEFPQGLELLARRGVPGVFPNSPQGKQAGQNALSQGLIAKHGYCPVPARMMVCITPKGVEWLVDALGVAGLLEKASSFLAKAQPRGKKSVDQDSSWFRIARALGDLLPQNPPQPAKCNVADCVLVILQQWTEAGRAGDCPLPQLFQKLQELVGPVSIGEFHDILRCHRVAKLVDLHPWTGPLYELPDPAVALMIGHEICYYACLGESSPTGSQSTDGTPLGKNNWKGIHHESTACQ